LSHAVEFLNEVQQVAKLLDVAAIEVLVEELARLRTREGRLFLIGVGEALGIAAMPQMISANCAASKLTP